MRHGINAARLPNDNLSREALCAGFLVKATSYPLRWSL
jgi:hypothetical protein